MTPGKFPYIIGGYWGRADARNLARGPRPPGMAGRGPEGFRPPPHPLMTVLDADGDHVLSAEEIEAAPEALRALDRNGDGTLSREELRPMPQSR